MKKKNSSDYEVLSTKVAAFIANNFKRLCKRKGITTYEALQNAVDTLVRYMDSHHNLSAEIEKAVSIFEHMQGWKDSFNLADPLSDPFISKAIYFLTAENKKGSRAVMVNRPFFGDWTETVNVQVILEQTMCILFPELYKRLRVLGTEIDSSSVLETIKILVEERVNEEDLKELRSQFEDNDRSEWGAKPHEGGPYKRKMHRDIDNLFPETDESDN